MNRSKHKILSGIYLVIDPCMEEAKLLEKISAVLTEVTAIQVYDNFGPTTDRISLIRKIIDQAHPHEVPVLINNNWELLSQTGADGVHFDEIPVNYEAIKAKVGRPFLVGLTCNNSFKEIKWADENKLDYISFCSIFPSSTSNSCTLVDFETIRKARQLSDLPIFLAGGITPEKIQQIQGLPFQGIAVISGIMGLEDPLHAILHYKHQLKISKHEN